MIDIIKGPKITWIDIQNPTEEDKEFLKKNYRLHPLVLEELTTPSPRPTVEHNPNYLFMVLYYPIYNKETKETFSRELDIIVTKNTIITAHFETILPVKRIFSACKLNSKARNNYLGADAGYLLYTILDNFWKFCLIKLERIDKSIDQIEKELFKQKEKEMVREISYIKADIITFWRVIEPQKEVLESLLKEGGSFFGKEALPYFTDLIGTFKKVWNNLQNYKETILALEDTNQSLLSTKTNEIIKLLTLFSVIMLPLTLLASIWGMNFSHVPLGDSEIGFFAILGLMLLILGGMIYYFHKKGWL